MAVVGAILLTILAALGVLLALALVMPLSARVEGAVDEARASLTLRARWALGLVGVDWRLGRGAVVRLVGLPVARLAGDEAREERAARRAKREARRAKREAKRARRPAKRARRRRGAGWAWRHREALWAAALRLVGTLHVRGRLTGVVGMPDPDQTAWVDVALRRLDRALPEGTVAVEVDYTDGVLEVAGRLSTWIVPLQVVAVALWVYLTPRVWRALHAK